MMLDPSWMTVEDAAIWSKLAGSKVSLDGHFNGVAKLSKRAKVSRRVLVSDADMCDARVMSDGVKNSGKLTLAERVACDTAVYEECARLSRI